MILKRHCEPWRSNLLFSLSPIGEGEVEITSSFFLAKTFLRSFCDALFFLMRKFFVISLSIIFPIIIIILYYFYNEANSGWSVQCLFHQITGLQCPGCGGQRALHYLLHGKFLTALRYNVLFVLFMPFFIYLYIILVQTYGLKKQVSIDIFCFSGKFGWIVLTVTMLFFILRNIPYIPFIYLSPPS